VPAPTGAGFHGYGFGFTTGARVARVPAGGFFSSQIYLRKKNYYFYVLNMATRQMNVLCMNCKLNGKSTWRRGQTNDDDISERQQENTEHAAARRRGQTTETNDDNTSESQESARKS
jgi:hypothetical protein